ncbi:hypothetical protein [uncultured Jatrophihabitans sp.]|uniref:hypothetical protein n=1 Tax=uncultured Jatrophihabitans sp. TaxID=1610747 RepID=UPI0035CAE592
MQSATGGRVRIWLAGFGVALVAALLGLFAVPTGSAGAAPTPNYTPGTDTATFTVTGVLDQNCLVSTGGTEIWIKPGDHIAFKSSLVGVSVGNAVAGPTLGGVLNTVLQPGQVSGLNVTATIFSGASSQTVTVAGGSTTDFPSSSQTPLTAGNHKIIWQATGLALLPGAAQTSVPLSNSALQSGADLSWTGVIHVTKSAPQCKLAVGTPQTKISVGPVHVGLPSVNVTVPGVTLPTVLPSVPNLNPGSAAPTGGAATPGVAAPTSTGPSYAPPAVSVPQMVVGGLGTGGGGSAGGGSGGNGGFRLGVTSGGSSDQLAAGSTSSGNGSSGSESGSGSQAQNGAGGSDKTVDLASSASSPSAQLPVLLAILAVITLAMVAGIYARLYLLGRKTSSSS